MDFSVSLPKLSYGQHETIRNTYKYADDLINTQNWEENMSKYTKKINRYINERDEYGTIKSQYLRDVGLNPKKAKETMDIFQTLSCNILNHYFFNHIGKIIKNQYEHYDVTMGTPIPTYPSTREIDVTNLPNEISNYILDISSIGNLLNDQLAKLVTPDKIELHEQYVKEGKYGGQVMYAMNPDLSKYGLYPEIVGTDIANLTSNPTESTSVAFVAGGLFDWSYVSPQQRTVGSSGDLGAIIIDILFRMIKKENSKQIKIDTVKVDSKNNFMYIFDLIKTYYSPLVEMNIIEELVKKNEDLEQDTKETYRNPVLLGIIDNEYRIPDIYALWCVYRSNRTPFYDGSDINGDIEISVCRDFFPYNIKLQNGIDLNFETESRDFNDSLVNKFKNNIITHLKGKNKKKSILSTNISNLVTEYNVPVTTSESLANQSIDKDVIKKLENISTEKWHNIITHAFTSLYLSLFIAADTNWEKISVDLRIEIPLKRMEYLVDNIPYYVKSDDRLKLIKISNSEYVKYRNTLKSLLGNNKNNIMGGTSLMGSNPISVERNGNLISYPGDRNLLEGISSYLTMFFSDIAIIENRLQQSLNNMGNMYWYRDVLKWLEILFELFKPYSVSDSKSMSSMEVRAKFYQLQRVLKNLYMKQLTLMNDYIQKSNILQRRYESGGNINKSLEKQIKITSNYTRNTICYIKRQILIIYYLLDQFLESWWTTPTTITRKRTKPVFIGTVFKPAYQNMKNELTNWFRGEISTLASTITNPKMLTEIRNLIRDTCETNSDNSNSQKIKTLKYTFNANKKAVITDIKFWLLLIANLKNKDITTISNQPNKLERLYIPVYDKSDKFYLFDIMPLVLIGNYKGTFGGMSPPQWLSYDDLKKAKYEKDNSGIIIISNLQSDVVHYEQWKAIPIEWLDGLVNKSTEAASNSGDQNRKLFLIRSGLYMMINESQIYESVLKTKKITNSLMRDLIKEYQIYSNNEKNTKNKYIYLVSREYVQNEMNSSTIQFYNI